LQKNDNSWTYFANDVAYHMDKINRNYKNLVNILGADHTGYIKRITAAVSALSNNKVKLNCKVCQLVKLYKNGKPFKMSKRAGEFISAQDLLNEVDKDPIRFMMLNRSNDVEIDFDFDKVKEKTKDNPVFYVQYAFARINSLLRILNINFNDKINLDKNNFNLNKNEEKIIRKIFEWPKIVESASKKFELHKIPFYLYELSTLFHAYWSKGNEDKDYKFIDNEKLKRIEILIIINLVATVIQNGMKILGVSLPEKM
jgi:arginyl-tRNA synthetase